MLRMQLPGKMKSGRPKRRCVDAVREEMAVPEVTGEDAEDSPNGDGKSAVATHDWRRLKKRRRSQTVYQTWLNAICSQTLICL